MCFMQTESVLQTKNRSKSAKNRFSVALVRSHGMKANTSGYYGPNMNAI